MATAPKQPQDHKPKADAVVAEVFTYTTVSGAEVNLPLMSNLKFGVARKLRHLSEEEQVFTLIEELSDEDSLAAIDDMDQDEVGDFMEAWAEASGISAGE